MRSGMIASGGTHPLTYDNPDLPETHEDGEYSRSFLLGGGASQVSKDGCPGTCPHTWREGP